MAALKKTDLYIKGLKIAWDEIDQYSYLRNIRTIAGISSLTFHAPITFFVGENGSGKSTLLEAMAVAYGFNPEGGTVNYNFSTYDSHSELCDALTLSKSFQKVYCGYGTCHCGVGIQYHRTTCSQAFILVHTPCQPRPDACTHCDFRCYCLLCILFKNNIDCFIPLSMA